MIPFLKWQKTPAGRWGDWRTMLDLVYERSETPTVPLDPDKGRKVLMDRLERDKNDHT